MSKEQKLNIVVNAKQKSYNLKEALAQKPEITSSALNVSPPLTHGNAEGKKFHAELERKARLPQSFGVSDG